MSEWQLGSDNIFQTRDGYVADRLREAILRGQLKPGQRLDQKELAELLNVSRSPVREALRTLAAEGLVEVYPHRGAVVADLSLEELEEIYFIRGTLEGTAARLAVSKIDDDRIAKLQTILEKLNETADYDQWLELNREFHYTIYQAINRPRLLSLIESLRNTTTPYTRDYITSPEHLAATRTGHKHILEALINRDGELAQVETQKHLKVVCDGVLVYFESILTSS